MDDNNHRQLGDDSVLPLPSDAADSADDTSKNPAADLIRKKVEAAYITEPSAEDEATDLKVIGNSTGRTKHQDFIYNLTTSGKSLAEINADWHEYYAGLPDDEKHAVWQEFYNSHAQASHYSSSVKLADEAVDTETAEIKKSVIPALPRPRVRQGVSNIKNYVTDNSPAVRTPKPVHPLHSLLFGLGVGFMVLLVVMFSFFNERFIAPFIQPSRNISNTPIITQDTAVSKEPQVIIPKINVQIPVVYGVNTIDDNQVENALESGVVHYADTATPGENGNVVVVGHSSNNIFNSGKYKFAFVLLSRLDDGDTFYLQKDGVRYTYQVYKKEIVKPTDVSVLQPTEKPATATLITCDPPGTSTNRLVVVGEQISPDPNRNLAQTSHNTLATQTPIIPGNSPSLWSRFTHWFTG
jgi:sortase A